MSISEIANGLQDFVVETRRALREHPETRWEEEWTLSFVHSRIEELVGKRKESKWRWEINEYRGGLVIDFTVDPGLPRILFRADVDALPIQEATGLSFASKIPGKMHACGHDCHTAMLLGAMYAITEKVTPTTNIRFIFQRAEENPGSDPEPISGGDMLVRDGVCEGISSAHMIHIWATGDSGVFYSRSGRMFANSDRMSITIDCSGGHVAEPHRGANAIDIVTDIILAMRGLPLRILGPSEPVSLVPATVNAGTESNIRPSLARLRFAVRNFLPPGIRNDFHEHIQREIKTVADRYYALDRSVHVEATVVKGHPMLSNTPEDYERVRRLLESAGEKTSLFNPHLGGEDFAYFLNEVPGSAWMLGVNQPGCGDHHTPTFNPDESVLWKGVLFWLLLATAARD